MVLGLFGALVRETKHMFIAAKMQTAGPSSLDASWLRSFADAIRAERALVNSFGFLVEFRNIERAAADAIAAADALVLLEIDDAIRVLDDRAVGRARGEAARLGA